MELLHAQLKARQRAERDNHPESIALRIHRALSWLDRAEQCDDDDARFIFLWVAFNAAYANDLEDLGYMAERRVFENFIQRLVDLDKEDALYNLVWTEFTSSIRILLDNQYVFGPFWEFQRGKLTEEQWTSSFEKAKVAANRALAKHRIKSVGYVSRSIDYIETELVYSILVLLACVVID
jgi:hypothetical protein